MGIGATQKKEFGPRGLGEIRTYKTGPAKVYIQEPVRDASGKVVEHRTTIFPILSEDSGVEITPIKDVYIELTPDQTAIKSVRPWEAQVKAQGFEASQRYFKGPLVVSLGADGVVPLTRASLGAYSPAANSIVANN